MKATRAWVAILLVTLAGCIASGGGPDSKRAPLGESLHQQRMLVVPAPPAIAASRPGEIAAAVRLAGRLGVGELARRDGARWLTVDALPLLTASAEGRRFLAATAPRALAQGAPAASCPALAAGLSPGGTQAEAVRAALEGCFAALGATHPGCGCRVVALDEMLAVPHGETAYATGTTARLSVPALGLELVLVAEELPGGGLLLRDLQGPVARVAQEPDGRVTLRFEATGELYEGRSLAVGFRRGRIAERIYATGPEGRQLSLLVGFEPDELAAGASAWLAWPRGG